MERSQAPKTIGILALIWAILSILFGGGMGGCCGIFGVVMIQNMDKLIPPKGGLSAREQLAAAEDELKQVEADIARLTPPAPAAGAKPVKTPSEEPADAPKSKAPEGPVGGASKVYTTYDRESLPAATAQKGALENDVDRIKPVIETFTVMQDPTFTGMAYAGAGFSLFDGLVLGTITLVAGIGLIKYSRWSYSLALLGLGGKALLNVVYLLFQVFIARPAMKPFTEKIADMQAQAQGAAANPLGGFGQNMQGAGGEALQLGIQAIAILVPAALLFFLTRPGARAAILGEGLHRADGSDVTYREP
ncbi:MAG: hypothetical protein HY719_07640 [Planctomycetes bacterium]|nr:hypothetical protein [Planctomycetota bacterium]